MVGAVAVGGDGDSVRCVLGTFGAGRSLDGAFDAGGCEEDMACCPLYLDSGFG